MLFRASAAEMKRSRASSEVRLKPPLEDSNLGFLPREIFDADDDEEDGAAADNNVAVVAVTDDASAVAGSTQAEFEGPSSGEESVMVVSLVVSSELDSVSEALAVFSLSMSSGSSRGGDGFVMPFGAFFLPPPSVMTPEPIGFRLRLSFLLIFSAF